MVSDIGVYQLGLIRSPVALDCQLAFEVSNGSQVRLREPFCQVGLQILQLAVSLFQAGIQGVHLLHVGTLSCIQKLCTVGPAQLDTVCSLRWIR